MKRRVYIITQRFYGGGIKQVVSDGRGKFEVFAGNDGKKRAEAKVKRMNKDYRALKVKLIKGWIEF